MLKDIGHFLIGALIIIIAVSILVMAWRFVGLPIAIMAILLVASVTMLFAGAKWNA